MLLFLSITHRRQDVEDGNVSEQCAEFKNNAAGLATGERVSCVTYKLCCCGLYQT